jgi:predicted nucleic-acid-binding Zn-ribbon protein
MSTAEHRCPKCQHELEEGFIADAASGGVFTSKWVEGAPEKSLWSGIKTKGKRKVVIVTLRCVNCGYLESYAK